MGAGVDALLGDPSLPDVPLVRYVDPDLTGRMVEYVTLHVLYHHRRMTEFAELQSRREWKYLAEPAAHEVRVGLMGLGVMGSAAAQAAQAARLSVARLEPHAEDDRRHDLLSAAMPSLEAFLADTDILAVLLPLTPETRGLLNRALIRKLSRQGRDERLPGPGADQCRPRRPAGRCRHPGGAGSRRAVCRVARRVRDRAACRRRARYGRIRASSSRRTTPQKARRCRSCAMPYASGSDISTACRSRTSWIASAAIEARGRTSTAPSVLTHQLSS